MQTRAANKGKVVGAPDMAQPRCTGQHGKSVKQLDQEKKVCKQAEKETKALSLKNLEQENLSQLAIAASTPVASHTKPSAEVSAELEPAVTEGSAAAIMPEVDLRPIFEYMCAKSKKAGGSRSLAPVADQQEKMRDAEMHSPVKKHGHTQRAMFTSPVPLIRDDPDMYDAGKLALQDGALYYRDGDEAAVVKTLDDFDVERVEEDDFHRSHDGNAWQLTAGSYP
ncbi:hypothetical protein NP233_g1973 [Leucocoprinus birnbaumii]|uniref:Uncharacterized protein n=1 Tax=Leucocoprinus birnbaumii TaxID=56174 RepID=A0AAD5YZ55_9AGAR|nr:hypothetical protein NP233_g1973 [Leucocoprinus birnbaumii]